MLEHGIGHAVHAAVADRTGKRACIGASVASGTRWRSRAYPASPIAGTNATSRSAMPSAFEATFSAKSGWTWPPNAIDLGPDQRGSGMPLPDAGAADGAGLWRVAGRERGGGAERAYAGPVAMERGPDGVVGVVV